MTEPSAVFVDPTRRRRRMIRAAATVGATLLLGSVTLLAAAVLGAPVGPLPSLSDPESGPASAVEQGGQAPVAEPTQPTVPPADRPGGRAKAPAAAITPSPTTTAAPGNRPDSTPGRSNSPPGRPTDLPAPPGHTR